MSEISLFETNKHDLTEFNFQKYEYEALRDPSRIKDYGYYAKQYILRDGPLADKIKLTTQRYGLTLDQLKAARKYSIRPNRTIIQNKQQFQNIKTIAKIIFAFTKKLMISKCCADMPQLNIHDDNVQVEDIVKLNQRKREHTIDEITKQLICDPFIRLSPLYFYKLQTISKSKTVQTQINSGWAYQTYFRDLLNDDYQHVIYKFFENWSVSEIIKLFLNLAINIIYYGIDITFTDTSLITLIQDIKRNVKQIRIIENNNNLDEKQKSAQIQQMIKHHIHFYQWVNGYEIFREDESKALLKHLFQTRTQVSCYIMNLPYKKRNVKECYYLFSCWRCVGGQFTLRYVANPVYPNEPLDLAFSPKKVLKHIRSSYLNEDLDNIDDDDEEEDEEEYEEDEENEEDDDEEEENEEDEDEDEYEDEEDDEEENEEDED